MREIGVLEAKTQLSALLAEIERTGQGVAITRHGKVVARLMPARRVNNFTREKYEELVRWREEVAREAGPAALEPFDWKEAVEDGRE